MNKKKWEKPELIVLLRNTPEEAVLQTCKFIPGTGPAGLFGWCYIVEGTITIPCEVSLSS